MKQKPDPTAHSPLHPLSVAQRSRGVLGFTLIEVMASLAVASIMVIAFCSVSARVTKQFLANQRVFVSTDQARSLASFLRTDGQGAAFGFSKNPNASGLYYTGDCDLPTAIQSVGSLTTTCTAVDNNGQSDRLRFATGTAIYSFVENAQVSSLGPCGSNKTAPLGDWIAIPMGAFQFTNGFTKPAVAPGQISAFLIGGDCNEGSPRVAGNDSFNLYGAWLPGQDGCGYKARVYYTEYLCPTGFKPGYTMAPLFANGYSVVKNTKTNKHELQLKYHGSDGGTTVLIENIANFKVAYGLDLSDPPDGKINPCPNCVDDPYGSTFGGPYSWCRNIEQGCGLTVNGKALTGAAKYNRIVAVNVSYDLIDDIGRFNHQNVLIAIKNRMAQ
jgi:prepilin-type N-terminal cleavage/methylation domain-containing protein